MRKLFSGSKERYLSGKRIIPKGITKDDSVTGIIDNSMLAYNGGRIRAACQLLAKKYSKDDVTVGVSLAGALTPAGLGPSTIIPLIKHGMIDWIVATGANMYHDIHYAFNMPIYQGSHLVDDAELRRVGIVRVYDIVFDFDDVLMKTDHILRQIMARPEFQKEMGTQEFYHLLGKVMDQFEKDNKVRDVSVLAAAYRHGVPVFTSSPGDSTIGMNIAGLEVLSEKFKLRINPSIDVNESTAIVLDAKKSGGKSGVILVGGGSPKNFMLQTEPQIQEVLMIPEVGQDYFLQITDARPDTGGLSGATPSEAVSWGKVDPNQLNDTVIVYSDSTIVLPLLTSYVLQNTKPKKQKRLYDRRIEMIAKLKKAYLEHNDEIGFLKKLLDKNAKP
jgi:deoxyhypusine synthase